MNYDENKILEEIESGYDLVVDKFSSTRNFFWPDLKFLDDYAKEGDRVLDFGCGNGRLLEILENKKIEYVGVDVSRELIEKAKEKYPKFEFSKIEAQESLPFSQDFFNVIFSIAVFHHFPASYQKKKLKELYNVLQPGVGIILTVWNLQEKYPGKKEVMIPFRDNEGNVFERYHYIFSEKSLQELLEQTGFQVEKCDTINKKNILIIARK